MSHAKTIVTRSDADRELPAARRAAHLICALITAVLVCTPARGQQIVQRLNAVTTIANASYGSKVEIDDDQIFVKQSWVMKDSSRYESGIAVYMDSGFRWSRTQIVTVGFPDDRGYIYDMKVAADQMFVEAYGIRRFVRNGNDWMEAGVLELPTPYWFSLVDMNENNLLIDRAPDKPDQSRNATVYRRSGDDWVKSASNIASEDAACLSGDDVLSLRYRGPMEETPTGAFVRNYLPPMLYLSTERDSSWAITDSLVFDATPSQAPHFACSSDGLTVAITYDDHTYIVDRDATGNFAVPNVIQLEGPTQRAMETLVSADTYYISTEETNQRSSVTKSWIDVYSRRLGQWEYIRTIEPRPRHDGVHESNDGCIGASMAANDKFLIAGAPVRTVLSEGVELRAVGEAYIFSLEDVDQSLNSEKSFQLGWSGVYPNPGRGLMTVGYSLPVDANVSADVFDMLGRQVATVESGSQAGGHHDLRFDTSNWASGVYVLRLSANQRTPSVQRFVVR